MAAYSTGLGPKQVAIQSLAYFFGSVLLHSAACVINDICDREFDRQVGELYLLLFTRLPFLISLLRALQEPPDRVRRRLRLWCHGLPACPGRHLPLDVGVHEQARLHRGPHWPVPLPLHVPSHEALDQLAAGLARYVIMDEPARKLTDGSPIL